MTGARRFLLSALGLIAIGAGKAQTVPTVISEHYTTAQGLPSNNVMCALRSSDGFLWLGTWYGLCRFDGGKFVTYNKPLKANSDIPPRKIESIAEDAQGTLWLKTVDWKLHTFNPRTERFHAVQDELKTHARNLQIIKIQRTDEGRILLLTKDKTLLSATTDKKGAVSILKLVDANEHIDAQTLQLRGDIVSETPKYIAYVGKDYRIFCLRKGKGTLQEAMTRDAVAESRQRERMTLMAAEAGITKYSQLYQDHDSMLWVTSPSQGLYCVSRPRHTFNFITLPDNDSTGVRCIYQTRQGSILVSTRSRNVYVYDNQGRLLRQLPYAQYAIGAIYHATEDNRGRLWLSTKGDGLIVATPDSSQPMGYQLKHYRHQTADATSISGNNVYFTYIDSRQHVWVGTLDGGLNLVHEDKDGQLTFYNKQHGFRHYPPYGLYTEVRNIVEDQQSRIWIGTIDGLMSIENNFNSPGQIHFTTYRDQPEATFANNDIYTLYRDQTGQIWIGAFGGGLQKLGERPLGPREGLRNDVIYSITEDLHGRLWLATEAGLSCYNQQTGRIRNFDCYDGIPAVQMEEASATCTRDGHLWIGTKTGILTFSPDQLQTSNTRYPTYITSVTPQSSALSPQPSALSPHLTALPYSDQIEMHYDQNTFTIEFATLKYQDHAQLSYRYQLEGYDRDWHYAGPHPVATYNEVPPGNYTFVVEAIDDANPTLQSSARLTIHILPPWWATWWACLIYLSVASLIAWLIVRTMLKMTRMRNEIYISQRLARLTSKPDAGDQFIDRLHHVIRQNIANSQFNIDEMATEMRLSRSAFYKKVKALTGFAPVDLLKEFRLSHAAQLLQTTNLNITEVAFRSGFKDPGYFGKCFRKRYGMSPREYIKIR